jgi:hypothetical protein
MGGMWWMVERGIVAKIADQSFAYVQADHVNSSHMTYPTPTPLLHQEFGQILLRPRELMSAVVRGHERHRSVTTLYWARNASLARVGTHEVIQPGIDRTSWCDLVNDAQVVGPGVSQSQDQFHLILDPQVDNNLVYRVCAEYELVSYL